MGEALTAGRLQTSRRCCTGSSDSVRAGRRAGSAYVLGGGLVTWKGERIVTTPRSGQANQPFLTRADQSFPRPFFAFLQIVISCGS